jgi:broad specificity phosphatase PhoE
MSERYGANGGLAWRRTRQTRRWLRSVAAAVALLVGGAAGGGAQTPPTPSAPPAVTAPSPADLELVKGLRAGGYAIVMRHAVADPDKPDATPLNFKTPRNQQPLTEAGIASARAFGEMLRVIGVPISEVLTSRFNRAYQTAVLAGFRDAKPVTELTEGSLVVSQNEQRRRASALKQLAAAPLPPGMNRLLVTHRINLWQAFGKEWIDVKEGEASVFRIDNGAYSLVARIQIGDWARLAKVLPR